MECPQSGHIEAEQIPRYAEELERVRGVVQQLREAHDMELDPARHLNPLEQEMLEEVRPLMTCIAALRALGHDV